MKLEKIVTITQVVETYCRPMSWAVVTIISERPRDEYVMALFHSKTDAEHFVNSLPPQNLEVRKVVSRD